MNNSSLTNNAILNIIKNGVNILFPLLSFPYISRVLGPESIGEVNYILSVVTYFTLFSTFGIPIYGTRELAKVRGNKKKFEDVTNELFMISLISTLVTYIMYIILIFSVPSFNEFKVFFLIAGFAIIFNTVGLEWLFQAMEDFFYITVRSIIIKLVSLILMFLFVHSSEDNIIYLSIVVFSTVGANLFNLLYSKKYIRLSIFQRNLNLSRHLKPLLILLSSSLAGSIYLGMDVFILGTLTRDFNLVGLYYASVKINRIVFTILAAVSTVIIPRMSFYVDSGETKKYKELLQRVFDINIQFALPVVLYLIIFAEEVIYLISGQSYVDAILTMQLITPMILTAAITNVIYNQILIPYNKEKIILLASVVGGLTCIILNLLLVPLFRHNGTAIATLFTEIAVMSVQLTFVYYIVKDHLFSRSQLNSLLSSIFFMLILILIKLTIENNLLTILISSLIGAGAYFGILYFLKDNNIKYFISRFSFIERFHKSR